MSYIRLEPMPHENITLGPDEKALEEYLVMKGRVILVAFSLVYILVGLPGIILTILVLRGPNFKNSDISFYLTVMSCINLADIFLFLIMPLVSGITGNPVENYNTSTCMLTYWTFMAVLSVNSWLLTPLTLAKILSTRFRLVQSNSQQLAFALSSIMVLCGATCGLLAIARLCLHINEIQDIRRDTDLWDPDLLDPDLWDPDIWDPDLWDPDLWEPDLLDPDIWDPDLWDPDLWDPDIWDPDLWDPDLWDPDIWDPDLWDPDLWDPDLWDPVIWVPDLRDPDLLDPDLLDPDLWDPDLWDPDLLDPDLLDPDLLDPDLWDPDLLDPDLLDPDLLDPDLWDPDLWDPDLWDPDLLDPDLLEPDLWDPDLLDPDLLDPDLLDPDLWDPDLLDPDIWDPDLWDPDLWDPDLWDPDLWDPELWDTDLWDSGLWGPNLIGTSSTRNLFVLTLEVTFVSLLPFLVVLGLFVYFFFMPAYHQPERHSYSRRRSSKVSRRSTAFVRNRRKSSLMIKISSAMQHFVLLLDLQYAASVLPTSTFYFFLFTHDTVTIIDEAREKFALNLAMLVHHLQVATNFILFYFCDEEVRRELCTAVHRYVNSRRVSAEDEILETLNSHLDFKETTNPQKQDEVSIQKELSHIIFPAEGTTSSSTAGQPKEPSVAEIKTPGEQSLASLTQRSANEET
ncbi:hypothetical protein Btru_045837 [Bulinus truncatus]|nr:hypothetical protein Btru_045837 [Bulinus truncatus]